MTGTLSLVGSAPAGGHAWDYSCACGIAYRVAVVDGRTQFWPRCGNGFSRTALQVGAPCIRCGGELSLNGGPAAG